MLNGDFHILSGFGLWTVSSFFAIFQQCLTVDKGVDDNLHSIKSPVEVG